MAERPRERARTPSPSVVMERIRELAAEHELLQNSTFAPAALRPEHHLVDDLGLDSIALMTLAVEVENEFRVAFTEEDDATLRTLGALAERVCELSEPAPAETRSRQCEQGRRE